MDRETSLISLSATATTISEAIKYLSGKRIDLKKEFGTLKIVRNPENLLPLKQLEKIQIPHEAPLREDPEEISQETIPKHTTQEPVRKEPIDAYQRRKEEEEEEQRLREAKWKEEDDMDKHIDKNMEETRKRNTRKLSELNESEQEYWQKIARRSSKNDSKDNPHKKL